MNPILQSTAGQSPASPREVELINPVVFIGGCPRSGTTLLQRMLNNHPQLAIANDSHFIPRALRKTSRLLYQGACRGESIALTPQLRDAVWHYHRFYRLGIDKVAFAKAAEESVTYQQLVTRLFDQFAANHHKPLAGEKTPDYVCHVPLLRGMYPQSRFIHIVRDGRDVALSLAEWATPEKGPGRLSWWEHDPLAVSALWWDKFMKHDPVDDPYCTTIRYEDLLDDAERRLAQLMEFLRLPYSDELLMFHVGKTDGESTNGSGTGSAKSRWLPVTKGLRDWRKQMPPEDVAVFELLAGETLQEHGYELSDVRAGDAAQSRAAAARQWWLDHNQATAGADSHAAFSTPVTSTAVNQHEAAFALRDPDLSNLKWVLNDDRFHKVVEENIGHVDSLKGCYLRYKHAQNCLVAFQHSDGTPWGFAIAHRADAMDKLAKASETLQKLTEHYSAEKSASEIGFVDHKRRLVVYRFPFDPQLPYLARLLVQRDREFSWASDDSHFEVLSYKPLRRCVLWCADHDGQVAVVRLYERDEYAASQLANKRLAESPWYAAHRLGHSKRHNYVAAEWIEGRRLDGKNIRPEHLQRAGQLLADLHRHPDGKLPIITAQHCLRRLADSVTAITQIAPQLQTQVLSLQARISDALRGEYERPVLSHGDFHAGQILEDQGNLRVVDWDNACNAPVGVDLGTFIAHHELRTHPRTISTDSLLAGYADANGHIPASIGGYVAWALLQVATQPFRYRQPNWYDTLLRLLDRADRWLPIDPQREVHSGQQIVECGPTVDTTLAYSVKRELDGSIPKWLRPALSPAQVTRRLVPLATQALQCVQSMRLSAIEIPHYVPDRRCVIKYAVDYVDAEGVTRRHAILGKVRRKGLDILAVDNQHRLALAFPQRPSQVSAAAPLVAQPLGVMPEWSLWLQSSLPGVSANRLLSPDADSRLAERIGAALATLHAKKTTALRQHSLDDELAILRQRLSVVRKRKPQWAERLDHIAESCQALAQQVSQAETTSIHRDFYPAQVICTADQVGFVDFDLFATGHPAIDVGNFVAHLKETALREYGDSSALAHHETAFINGYVRGNPLQLSCIGALTTISLARHIYICHRIRARRPYRKAMIELCESLLQQHNE